MPRNEQRHQKKLALKRAKQRVRQKQIASRKQQLASLGGIIAAGQRGEVV